MIDYLNICIHPYPHCHGFDPVLFCRFEKADVPDVPYRSRYWILYCPSCGATVSAPDLPSLLVKWHKLS